MWSTALPAGIRVHRIKIRVICARPYHALFMHNMLIRPTADELAAFGEPDYVIYNAGQAPANPKTPGMTSPTSVSISFERGEMVILGTEYAGEMKKGVFTMMNYLMPKQDVLSMHCSANEGEARRRFAVLRALGHRQDHALGRSAAQLIGDDEHCWSDDGVFNIEGGCYAKCIHLSAENEPETLSAHPLRRGAGERRRRPAHAASRLTTTPASPRTRGRPTRSSSSRNAKIPCVGGHPTNIIFLTCDAFGVLPPVSRLTPEQAMYHFISGYTAKVAGTEVGVIEPQATFSACFGAAFLVVASDQVRPDAGRAAATRTARRPGWSTPAGPAAPTARGKRIKLAHTRAIIDAIHIGRVAQCADDRRPDLRPGRAHACARACPTRFCIPSKPGPIQPPTGRRPRSWRVCFSRTSRPMRVPSDRPSSPPVRGCGRVECVNWWLSEAPPGLPYISPKRQRCRNHRLSSHSLALGWYAGDDLNAQKKPEEKIPRALKAAASPAIRRSRSCTAGAACTLKRSRAAVKTALHTAIYTAAVVALAGANANRARQIADENLAVADLAGAGRA